MEKVSCVHTTTYELKSSYQDNKQFKHPVKIYLDVHQYPDDQLDNQVVSNKTHELTEKLKSSADIRRTGDHPPLLSLFLQENNQIVVQSGRGNYDYAGRPQNVEDQILNDAIYTELLQQVFNDFAVSLNNVTLHAASISDFRAREQKVISIANAIKADAQQPV